MSAQDFPRVLVYDVQGNPLFELDPTKMLAVVSKEQINGEHSLTVTTLQTLEKEQRIIFQDSHGAYQEYVVQEIEQTHKVGLVECKATCVWALQHDLMVTKVSSMPGVQNPVSARVAMEHALAGTSRWTLWTVDVDTLSGGSMYNMSGWDALKVVIDKWGGEIVAEYIVRNGVPSRRVSLLKQQGRSTPIGRFEYAHSMSDVKRTVASAPWTCRIIPYGKGEETEGGGYGRRIDITSVNGGIEWLQDDEVVDALKLPSGDGWEYPTQIVIYADIEDPQKLKNWALAHIHEYTRPRVSYSARISTLANAGLRSADVRLGDVVQCVDYEFADTPLVIEARVVKIEVNELDRTDTKVEVGYLAPTLASQFKATPGGAA